MRLGGPGPGDNWTADLTRGLPAGAWGVGGAIGLCIVGHAGGLHHPRRPDFGRKRRKARPAFLGRPAGGPEKVPRELKKISGSIFADGLWGGRVRVWVFSGRDFFERRPRAVLFMGAKSLGFHGAREIAGISGRSQLGRPQKRGEPRRCNRLQRIGTSTWPGCSGPQGPLQRLGREGNSMGTDHPIRKKWAIGRTIGRDHGLIREPGPRVFWGLDFQGA